ncbi:hypothetical protein ABKV19_009497 [Rosa sericea]
MANVFGIPIIDSTLAAMPEYANKQITAVDRARVALHLQSADMKAANALTYVENLKKQYGGEVPATLCLLYNATGNTLTFVTVKDEYGHIGPAPYPLRIQNGQWGAFLHVKTAEASTGSYAGVVYRGKNPDGVDWDCMMAWRNPFVNTNNSVWSEIREPNHFDGGWSVIANQLLQLRYNYSDTWQGGLSTIATGRDTSPIVEAVFTLEDAAKA